MDSLARPPVYFTQSLSKHDTIRCEVCNVCHWQINKNGTATHCIYGGPFLGYEERVNDNSEISKTDYDT